MPTIGRSGWTRQQLLVAFALYCRMPFGRLHAKNPEIVRIANAIDRTPSALAMKLVNIASLDPEITDTGRSGLKNASTNDRAMWDEMQDNWDRFAVESDLATRDFEAIAEPLGGEIPGDDSGFPVGEDRAVHTTVRIGQDFFRAAVLSAYSAQCCITGLSMPKLLVASHIVPWRIDRLNRVNPRNGLLLSALHDKAFDIGLITIEDNMTVRVSRKHPVRNDRFFSHSIELYDGQPIRRPEKFRPDKEFLAYHREHVFLE
jgi:predicted restriction endonuclease